ncbi:hypothetical protein CWS43_09895 [Rahnella sp. AA]|uniref:hypothetical protein n=1 Tax=Rahnella sp. AA TaxID=2057180 RepID=UPI000C339B61|nr:hypothetical protein [Rahnella sp. AA]PKE30982.1 hypothetical protein CWS43_09895 [Rahnella sp. AA]
MTGEHLVAIFSFLGVCSAILFSMVWMCVAARICWAYFNFCVRKAIKSHDLLKHINGIPKKMTQYDRFELARLAEEEKLIEQKLNRIREQRREIINRSDANKVKV